MEKRLQNAKVLEPGKLLVRTSFVSQPTSFTRGVGTPSVTHSNCVHSRAQVSALIVQFSVIKSVGCVDASANSSSNGRREELLQVDLLSCEMEPSLGDCYSGQRPRARTHAAAAAGSIEMEVHSGRGRENRHESWQTAQRRKRGMWWGERFRSKRVNEAQRGQRTGSQNS